MSTLLSINNYYYRRGGAEVVFLEQNRLFEEIGWQVASFAMLHPNNITSPWQKYFIDEIEFGDEYSIVGKVMRAIKIIHSLEAQRKIGALASQIQPDIAHAHNVYHHISPAIFSTLKKLAIPVVLTLHDLKIACPSYHMLAHDGICERCKNGALWNVARHRCIKHSIPLSVLIMLESTIQRLLGSYSRYVDIFITPSRFYLEKLVEWGWPRERFRHIPNFIDLNLLQADNHPGKAFAFFGRLSSEKGVATFIKAVAKANVAGMIIGSGPEETALRQLAHEYQANVEFLGYRSGDALFDTVRQARTVVLPSEWYENAPMSVMETYALQRPVIGADIGGIPELIRPGETGALFPSGNVDALAEQLILFKTLPDKEILAMGKRGREWAQQEFTATQYRERLLQLYRELGVNA